MKSSKVVSIVLLLTFTAIFPHPCEAASAAELNRQSKAALRSLYSSNSTARSLGGKAKAILVFPAITKGGFVVGAQHGDGVLFVNGKTQGFYTTVAASYGLQAGVQKFGYALFFMDSGALSYLNSSRGWEIGTGPSVVVVDTGIAKSLSTTTLQKGVYAFFFNQKGLMAGLGLQGTKITPYTPSK